MSSTYTTVHFGQQWQTLLVPPNPRDREHLGSSLRARSPCPGFERQRCHTGPVVSAGQEGLLSLALCFFLYVPQQRGSSQNSEHQGSSVTESAWSRRSHELTGFPGNPELSSLLLHLFFVSHEALWLVFKAIAMGISPWGQREADDYATHKAAFPG